MKRAHPFEQIVRCVALLAEGFMLAPGAAWAGANQHTFVSSQGLDTNACISGAPCRTLQAALAATSSGGEIILLDSAAYGALTIGQTVSIIAPSGVVGIVPSITVNGSAIEVILKGLDIEAGGGVGITFQNGSMLSLDRIEVNGGIQHNAAGGSLTMANSVARNAENCFVAQGASASSLALATIVNSRAEGCVFGFVAQANSIVSISQTTASGKGTNFDVCYADFAGLGTGVMGLDSVVATNCAIGIASGPVNYPGLASVTVSNSLVTGNATGIQNYSDSSGVAKGFTYGNNRVFGNGSNSFSFTALTTQ